MMFKAVRGLENMDREDLLTMNDGGKSGHEYTLKKTGSV